MRIVRTWSGNHRKHTTKGGNAHGKKGESSTIFCPRSRTRIRLSRTSFDGREVHPLVIRSLTKEEAFTEYRNSGGGAIWILNELEENMPYAVLKAETLDVMILDFGSDIGSDEALVEMNKLGVRPLIYEELIQYGIAYPKYQKQKKLIALGTKHILGGRSCAPGLGFCAGDRNLIIYGWSGNWGVGASFPVVRK